MIAQSEAMVVLEAGLELEGDGGLEEELGAEAIGEERCKEERQR